MFRKQHGAAFRSRARVQSSDFKWVKGEDPAVYANVGADLTRYEVDVDGINLASRAGIAENGQLLPMQQPTTVDAGQKPEAVIAA